MRQKAVEVKLRDVPGTDAAQTVNTAARLVSAKVGVIRSLGRGISRAQDPRCLSFGISGPDLLPVCGAANSPKAGGAGESFERALAATIGEAVERYCTWFYDTREMVFGSYEELNDEAVHPDLLRLYSEEQCSRATHEAPLDFFTERSRINWVRGFSLTHEVPRLVPASLVYLGYEYRASEAHIGHNASTGLAAGGTLEEAVLSGVYECIERDAFTVCWLCRRPGRRIHVDDQPILERINGKFDAEHTRVDMAFFDITLDIPVPCLFSYMVRPSEFGRTLSVSSVARMDPRDGISKCLNEMAQFLPYFRYLNTQMREWMPRSDFSDLTSFDHHCMLYVKRPELIDPALQPYRSVQESVALSAMDHYREQNALLTNIRHCIRALKANGFEVIVVDITTPDVEDVGLRVVRVLVPGLINLHGNENFPFHGSARLQALNDRLNPGVPISAANPYPHPFP